jgi:hypothetical protein
MAYLQTNTHLENLEVVEWDDNAVHKKKIGCHKVCKGG